MFKEYGPVEVPENGKSTEAEIAVINYLETGMNANVYSGKIVSAGLTVTISIEQAGIAISAKVEDLLKVIRGG